MTENTAFAMGWVSGLFMGMGLMKIAWEHEQRLTRRRPYSSAAIAFRATAEDAAKVRSKIVNPLVWEDPPEQFIRMDEGPVQRGNGSGGPTTPKPPIVPKGQAVRTRRWFINNPVQIAECGGPCTVGPSHCDCGALWVDVPTPNPPPEVP